MYVCRVLACTMWTAMGHDWPITCSVWVQGQHMRMVCWMQATAGTSVWLRPRTWPREPSTTPHTGTLLVVDMSTVSLYACAKLMTWATLQCTNIDYLRCGIDLISPSLQKLLLPQWCLLYEHGVSYCDLLFNYIYVESCVYLLAKHFSGLG